MITGLYETHLHVTDLERSVDFYKNVLQLEQCSFDKTRMVAFFWIGQPKQAMLGLWQKPKEQVHSSHFAFSCDTDFIVNDSVSFLKERGLQPYNFLKDGKEQPMVFTWMPTISIYFNDPDGHVLEFISVLEGDARPELGIISYEEWLSRS